MVQRIEAGTTHAEVARQMHLSRGTVAKWWGRWCTEGEARLADRSSRPHRSPRRTDPKVEERVCRLRQSTRRGPVYLAARTGVQRAGCAGLCHWGWAAGLFSGPSPFVGMRVG